VADQELASAQIASLLVNQRHLCSAETVRPVVLRFEVDHPHPLTHEPGALSGANVLPRPAAAREQLAHDAMHGSLAPGRPRLNIAVGSVALGLYAGFHFEALKIAHHAYHAAPGTADDPDFHADAPRAFAPWFYGFFRTYFGWRQLAVLTLLVGVAVFAFGARIPNLLVFWAAPALLSALQLFTFGTWLPHRHPDDGFPDHHNARTSSFSPILSLLTCFHFGRHYEHHLTPWVPWWRLWRPEG